MARTVLLADDSVTAQNMGRRILIDAGYEVITVNNGSAALKKIHESRPDLIVLDVYMPGYGGLEVCQRLKESAETARIPILLTVGKMEPFKTDEARRVRADGHLVKPFEASELLAALTKLEDRIVPQAELPRGRKPKSEKKSKAAFDPAMGFDDAQSEKIAYLAEVKQRRAERERGGEDDKSFASTEAISEAPPANEMAPSNSDRAEIARPMSVYAAEALREMPVVPETVAAPEQTEPDSLSEQQTNSNEPALPAEQSDAAAPTAIEEQPSGIESQPIEIAPAATTENSDAEEAVAGPASFESTAQQISQDVAPVQAEFAASPESAVDARLEPPAAPQDASEANAEPTPPAPQTASAVASRWVAENVPVTPEEAALELEHEMRQLQAEQSVQQDRAVDTPSEEPFVANASASETQRSESIENSSATFAAAASASASSAHVVPVASASGEPVQALVSETAAAWENWRHIRDSVMGSQTAVSVSESVAEAVQAQADAEAIGSVRQSSQSEEAQSTEPSQSADPAADVDADAENAALSSIVDSVLAELKPKLMQEISKKLKK